MPRPVVWLAGVVALLLLLPSATTAQSSSSTSSTCGCLFIGYQGTNCSGTLTDTYAIGVGTPGVCLPNAYPEKILNNSLFYTIVNCTGNMTFLGYQTQTCGGTGDLLTDTLGCRPYTLPGLSTGSYYWSCGNGAPIRAPLSLALLGLSLAAVLVAAAL